jgi:asparagine synthase (glutamine-hydrolysing)
MAHSIESRVPFLTTDLVSFCLSLPSEYLIDYKANTKAVFKKAMAGILPTEIIERKDKIGFTVPEKDWMLSHSKFIEDALDFSRLPVKLATIKKRWVAMRDGGSPYDPTIWRTVSLGLFCEQNNVSFN